MAADLHKAVPRERDANLQYRLDVRRRAAKDAGFRKAMADACREDVLFFFNAFCWLYEPRPQIVNGRRLPMVLPFITWEHQEPIAQLLEKHLGFDDIGILKSRGEGLTWMACLLAVRDWLFKPMTAIGMVSRNERAVGDPHDPDSLFWKFDFELEHLPRWMAGKPGRDYKRMVTDNTRLNLRNGSTVSGYAATQDAGSGGRKTWWLMDELAKFPRPADEHVMASTQYTTSSRLVISTPKGSTGAYYALMHQPSGAMIRQTLYWWQNPTRNRGLYRLVRGRIVAEDPQNNPLPAGYEARAAEILARLRQKGFAVDGVLRSPWYDRECDRPGMTPQLVAQELDGDFGGSVYRVFGHDALAMAEDTVQPALCRGTLVYDDQRLDKAEFSRRADGPLSIWCPLDSRNDPPPHQYVVGGDVAVGMAGRFVSNSVLQVIDLVTMEQVAEFASPTTLPCDLADMAVALCHWFYGAYLIWESNGPGKAFTKQVKTRQYSNCYVQKDVLRNGPKKNNRTCEWGWHTGAKTKEILFSEMLRSILSREVVLRSRDLLYEMSQYVRNEDGRICYEGPRRNRDTGEYSHGDRVIAMAVAIQGMRDRPLVRRSGQAGKQAAAGIEAVEWDAIKNPPTDTLAARILESSRAVASQGDDWDDRDNSDLAVGRRLKSILSRIGRSVW